MKTPSISIIAQFNTSTSPDKKSLLKTLSDRRGFTRNFSCSPSVSTWISKYAWTFFVKSITDHDLAANVWSQFIDCMRGQEDLENALVVLCQWCHFTIGNIYIEVPALWTFLSRRHVNFLSKSKNKITNMFGKQEIWEKLQEIRQASGNNRTKQRTNENKFEKKQSISNLPPIYKTGIESKSFGITTNNFLPFRLTGKVDSDHIWYKACYTVSSSIKERLA